MSEFSSKIFALLKVERDEAPALAWAFLYFFLLLCSYYILRPVRDEMGIQGGVNNLPYLFSATFIVMLLVTPLFGFVSGRFPRRRLLPIVYCFFAANLGAFYFLFDSGANPAHTAKAFFVWVSVFNLYVVSVFWSFLADIFNNDQGKRLFGVVAAGGSAGAIAGPLLTSALVKAAGVANLLLLSGSLLLLTVVCIRQLGRWADRYGVHRGYSSSAAIGGGIWAGIRSTFSSKYLFAIACYLTTLTLLATLLYVQQQQIVSRAIADSAQRTQLFAQIDLAVNSMVLVIEIFLTNRLIGWLGVSALLTLGPLLNVLGYGALAIAPVLAVLIVFQALRRAVEYAVARPVREVLFTVVNREEKYKAKNFIDTVIARGSDAASAWAQDALKALGAGLAQIALLAIPVALASAAIGWFLGAKQEALRRDAEG